MSQWIGLAVICLAGWGIAELVMRGCSFAEIVFRKPNPVPPINIETRAERFTTPGEPPSEVFLKHGGKWIRYTRHDAAEADANNKAWRKSDGE